MDWIERGEKTLENLFYVSMQPAHVEYAVFIYVDVGYFFLFFFRDLNC